ncbi:orotidine-5'-phosphate decarboxylase [Planctomicrobium piriforme]|uniref:Orotidine 5'-phosphate decarboxylase n=1 Tax=Planctomicrobium piriforme TaxID=1576369 RepID=A0A1I3DMK1_9PLAN|nr:orotidine-5'-phosphate decarboxylase [Planctomicrobium piriforme]SFH87778.1 orotidine-5'-phosphate decarboxylase [Planctomicrobium piriforme]
MTSFANRLHREILKKQTPALVGLDPRWDQLPREIQERASQQGGSDAAIHARAFEEFCLRVIDVVSGLVPAVKPQSAFFEACGPDGSRVLANVIQHARNAGLIVICDAKRGDIGTTAEAYAAAYLAGEDPQAAPYAADALTINPYMGVDTLQPFVSRADAVGAGLYVLVRTSNPGARDFQDRQTDDETLYTAVARQVENLSLQLARGETYGSVGAVTGATYPEELAVLRKVMPHTPLLIPGYGSQGGTSQDVAAAFDGRGLGGLVNNSRGILFGFRKGPLAEEFGEARWEAAVQAATVKMIDDLAANTPAGKLRQSSK